MIARTSAGNSEEAAEALRLAAAKLREDLARTARDAQEAAAQFAAAVQGSAGEFGLQAQGATRSLQRNFREHPVTWAAAAIGVGAVLAVLLAARRS